jgi:hypothetical protein
MMKFHSNSNGWPQQTNFDPNLHETQHLPVKSQSIVRFCREFPHSSTDEPDAI